MFIKFKTLEFKNFMGFGANLTSINFDNPGLSIITGQNGSGKSSFAMDALSFALYGKPYRKIKINELINRSNKKKLFVRLVFESNGTEYTFERGIKPNIFLIYKGDDTTPQDMLSSKALNQDEINKIIGIDYDLFKNILALSLSYNKPFLTLPAQDKRNYIESIFNIKIFSEMLALVKKENTDLKLKVDMNDKTLIVMENNLKSNRLNIRNIKKTVENFEKDKKQEIQKYTDLCKKLTINNEQLILSLKDFNVDKLNEQLNVISGEIAGYNSEVSRLGYEISSIRKNLDFFNNDICPTCRTPIDPVHKQSEIEKLTAELVKNEELLHSIVNKILPLKNKKYDSIDADLRQLSSIQTQIQENERDISGYNKIIESIHERKLSNINIDGMYKDLEKKSSEYSELYAEIRDYKETLRINNIIQALLQDDGIKTYFIQHLLPLLNERINHYLNKFEIPIVFSFNEMLEENIRSLESFSENISYYAFSEGEKKRIDIAILFSFIDLTKKVSNWSCNLLLIDELFDSAVDTDGLDQIMLCLRNISREENNLGIYLISHRMIEGSYFAGKISIQKEEGFSKLERLSE